MEQLNPGVPVYNEAEAVRLIGELNIDAMERALNIIIERHDILRTTIHVKDSEPTAVVHPSWPIQFKKLDLSALAVGERQAESDRLLTDEPRRPYHLETEPGIRATLLCLGPQEHVLILMMHHIICDWSSEGVLWRELANLYRMLSRGEEVSLPPLTIQHGDYAAWQAQQNTDANFAEDLVFWEQKLRGAPQLLELPADRTRPPTVSHRGARQRFVINSTLTKALRDLGQRAETTLFSVFAAALNTLIYRYTGQEDILIGIPIADRDRMELQQLIGFLLHTQVLRTELSGDMTFRKLLARVQKAALELYLHRAVPFDQVVRKIQPERNLSYSPLFQVMLNWRDRDQLLSFIGLEGLVIESLLADSRTSKFDLTLFATDCGNEIWLEMEYSTDLFDEARIARMLGHFQTVLESVVADPDGRLAGLPLLTLAERRLMLDEWNRTEHEYPRDRMLHELIEEQVERTPDAVAVVFENRQLSYRQLNDRANRLSQHLQNLGVGPNVLVAICVERSLEMMVGLLAILKAGGAYVPLDPAFPIDRLAFMLEDCQPRVVLTLKRMQERVPIHKGQPVWIDAPLADPTPSGDQKPQWNGRRTSDLAYVLYTSGSTGKPKGVQISNRAVVNFLSAMRREPGLLPTDAMLAVTTISFDIAGLELFLPLIIGARVVIASQESTADGAQLSSMMKRHGITVMQATPVTWRLLLEAGWSGSPDLKILCGGEAWPPTLARELLPRCRSLWNMYGPTETTIWSSVKRVTPGDTVLMGPPIPNTTFYVLDAKQQLVPIGVPGELYIGGDGLADGYLNRADLTCERFVSDPFSDRSGARLFKTGDVVRRSSDGMIEFLFRSDQQVKVRGFRIELGDVEAAFKQHLDIAQCTVVAQSDARGGKRLVAYVVPSGTWSTLKTSELRAFLRQKLPEYMVPSVIETLDRFPLTPNGKIDRKALAAAQTPLSEFESSVHVSTPLELFLQKIWERVLNVGTIRLQGNFFDLGGHSLLAVRLINEINKSLNVSLTTQILFLNPTIERLAAVLLGGKYAKPGSHLIPLREGASQGGVYFLEASLGVCRLAQGLDVGLPLYATQVPLPWTVYRAAILNEKFGVPSIEEMAAPHVAIIRSQNLSGPCVLVGHSFYGFLAIEVAHQLRRGGMNVDKLLVLDTLLMPPPLWYRLKVLSLPRFRDAMKRRFKRLVLKATEVRDLLFPSSRAKSTLDSTFARVDQLMFEVPFELLKETFDRACEAYPMHTLESQAVLFLSQAGDRRYARSGRTLANIKKISRLFARGFTIVETPGDHRTMLEKPNLPTLARKVNQYLEQYSCSSSQKWGVNRAYDSNQLSIGRPVSNHMALEESEIK